MKIIITESKIEKVALNWLNDEYGDLEPYDSEKYPGYIFYIKGNKIIFDYHKESGEVFVSGNEIWSFFKMYFGMSYEQIQKVTMEWIEENYNLIVSSTNQRSINGESWWNDVLN
jgi:hypothetical protein